LIYQPSTGLIKIIDFGFAISCKDNLKVVCGTPSYMSPELVSKKEYNGAAADMWAVGIVMYALLSG
jgi:MAP/microtubule affinity-regulating kinase